MGHTAAALPPSPPMEDICYGFFAALSCPQHGCCRKAHDLADIAAPDAWVVFRSRNVCVAQHLVPRGIPVRSRATAWSSNKPYRQRPNTLTLLTGQTLAPGAVPSRQAVLGRATPSPLISPAPAAPPACGPAVFPPQPGFVDALPERPAKAGQPLNTRAKHMSSPKSVPL